MNSQDRTQGNQKQNDANVIQLSAQPHRMGLPEESTAGRIAPRDAESLSAGEDTQTSAPIHILVVDDHPPIRTLMRRLLESNGYLCSLAADAEQARQAMECQSFELVLFDINMPPGESGFELVRSLASDYPDTAVMMVTAEDNTDSAEIATSIGAYGYVIKPFKINELLINISNALRRRKLEIENRRYRENLEQTVAERTSELRDALVKLQAAEREIRGAHEETVFRLMRAAEFRDNETAQHIQRMSQYCVLLARLIGNDSEYCDLLRLASPLHDIGKIGTPDQILLKPGRLTSDEFEIMKQHADIGCRILQGTGIPMLEMGATIAYTHHEKYNGKGYPMGLKGEDIPIEGRITAIADVFDALTSKRVYKSAHTIEESIDFMRSNSGEHFDPNLLDIFVSNLELVLEIKRQFPED